MLKLQIRTIIKLYIQNIQRHKKLLFHLSFARFGNRAYKRQPPILICEQVDDNLSFPLFERMQNYILCFRHLLYITDTKIVKSTGLRKIFAIKFGLYV